MAKNRIFGRPVPDASVPRNGFDMSKRINMQLPFGALIPCYAHQYIAGSQVRINVNSFFRTAAVNTAAFPRLKMETEFFCVPLRYLWSYWDNFKLAISDYNSTSLLNTQNQSVNISIASVPTFDTFSQLWAQIGSSSAKDSLGYSWSEGAKRLADMLGYGRYNPALASDVTQTHVQAQNYFKIAAYQKVYYDHFRNTAYENNNPYNYNLDCYTAPDSVAPADLLERMFTLRYVNYRKDYFQNIFPGLNFIYNSGSVTPVQISLVPSWIQGLSTSNNGDEFISPTGSRGGSTRVVSPLNNASTHALTSAQGIRAMFALDKLTRSSAYAPQHVKNQYEARYGIKFPSTSSFESQRIGSFDTDIIIGEVTSTANTESGSSGDALGAIGGKGVGSANGNHMIKFDVKEDSIILGVCYAVPRTMYDSYRFDNWNMKTQRSEFFIPEFMNMGLKPVYAKELGYYIGQQSLLISTQMNEPLGYQLPYTEYKCDVDENHGLFADKNSDLGQFTVHSNGDTSSIFYPGVNYTYFKVKPSDLDSIFVNAYNGTESTDQLFGELTFTIPVNQNMSVHGVPSL